MVAATRPERSANRCGLYQTGPVGLAGEGAGKVEGTRPARGHRGGLRKRLGVGGRKGSRGQAGDGDEQGEHANCRIHL